MEIKVIAWLSQCRCGFVCEALGLRSSCRVAHTLLRPSVGATSTRASLSPSSLIVSIKEYNEEEAPNEGANTRPSSVSGTPGTGCPGPAARGALQSQCGPHCHAVRLQGRGQGTPGERNVRLNMVVVGAAAKGVSPEIDVRTQKDGVALIQTRTCSALLVCTRTSWAVDALSTNVRWTRRAWFRGNDDV